MGGFLDLEVLTAGDLKLVPSHINVETINLEIGGSLLMSLFVPRTFLSSLSFSLSWKGLKFSISKTYTCPVRQQGVKSLIDLLKTNREEIHIGLT